MDVVAPAAWAVAFVGCSRRPWSTTSATASSSPPGRCWWLRRPTTRSWSRWRCCSTICRALLFAVSGWRGGRPFRSPPHGRRGQSACAPGAAGPGGHDRQRERSTSRWCWSRSSCSARPRSFADSASDTLLPSMVASADLGVGNARMQGAFLLTNQLVAPPIGAFLFAVGMALPFAANAAAFVLGALLIWRIGSSVAATAANRGGERAEVATWPRALRWLAGSLGDAHAGADHPAFNVTFGAAWGVLVLYADAAPGHGAGGLRPADHGRGGRAALSGLSRTARSSGASAWATSCASGCSSRRSGT